MSFAFSVLDFLQVTLYRPLEYVAAGNSVVRLAGWVPVASLVGALLFVSFASHRETERNERITQRTSSITTIVALRACAQIIDGFISAILFYSCALLAFTPLGLASIYGGSLLLLQNGMFALFSGVAFVWIYHAVLESSSLQGTIGKLFFGICVVNEDGGYISFRQASRRFLAKILSVLSLGAGFAMALFSSRTQTLHDRIARTVVVRRAQSDRLDVGPSQRT